MSTITNNKDKQIAKYLKDNRGEIKLSIGSLAIYMRPIDFPYLLRNRFGFFNTGLLYGGIISVLNLKL